MTTEVELPANGKTAPPALVALVAPDKGMERQARIGTVKLPFVIAMVCALLAGAIQAWRVDGRSTTLRKLERQGQLQNMSDRAIEDETRNSERIYMVLRVAGAAAEAPLGLGLCSLAVLGLGWFLKGRIKGSAVVPVAAATLLPGAVANLLDAVAAFRHSTLPPEPVTLAPRTLNALLEIFGHPLMGPWAKLGNALDFYTLWAALLMGYGVAAVAQIPLRRAMTGTMVAWVCLRLLTKVAAGG